MGALIPSSSSNNDVVRSTAPVTIIGGAVVDLPISSPEVDISHNSLSSANSVVSPTRQLDASDLLGNSEAAITSEDEVEPEFLATCTLPLSFASFNPLSSHRSPVASPALVPYSQTHPAISIEERPRTRRNTPNHLSSTSDSALRRSPLERRREVDAGPVFDEDAPEDEGMSTLPPLYEQVFRSPVDVQPMTSNLRTRNITYDDRDMVTLKYQGFWFHDGTWNASNVGDSGTLSSSNDPLANITFNFPEPAIAFYFFGIQRLRGGLYGICIDCSPNNPRFQTVDGLSTSDDGQNPPTVLFSKRFDTSAQHVIILRNENDTRIVPGGNSQIAIDRFVLEVPDDSAPVTSSSPLPSPTSTSDSGKSGPPIGAIVGAVGGFLLAVILIVVGLHYRHRRKRSLLAFAHEDVSTNPSEASFPDIVPYSVMHPSISKEERPKAGESNSTSQRPSSPTTSSGSASISAYLRFQRRERRRQREVDAAQIPERRREADAGPVPLDDERSTLPPLYEEVFQAYGNCEAGPSSRPPSGEVPHPGSTAATVQGTEK
ncbi:hypothetical protein AAF712_011664 [Marasmius tenuissimus]|uniref:Uncharacterized protein n=1 Tax=Marasmius tenuissimus TaxID=585030 RepID=A0ABR2ZIL7_9AGAR